MNPLPWLASTSLFTHSPPHPTMRAQNTAAVGGREVTAMTKRQAPGEVRHKLDPIESISSNPFLVLLIERSKSYVSGKAYQHIGIKVNILYSDYPHAESTPIIPCIVRTTSPVTQPQIFLTTISCSITVSHLMETQIWLGFCRLRNIPWLPTAHSLPSNKEQNQSC